MDIENGQKFCDAITSGDNELASAMLAEKPELANAVGLVHPDHREFMDKQGSAGGWSALHLAAHYGRPEIVRVLIDLGAKLDAVSDNRIGNTPLHAAVVGGSVEAVQLLVAAGADSLALDSSGSTPTELAKTKGQSLVEALS